MKLLEARELTKTWGGNLAVDGVSFEMEKDILGIVGPNGAGKTTLLNVIAGNVQPTAGRVLFSGEDVTSLSSWKRVKIGISKTYQVVRPFRSLSVRQNLEIFSMIRDGSDIDWVLEVTGLEKVAGNKAGALPYGLLKKLEIGKILSSNPKLMLLDEPFGGLSQEDISSTLELLKNLKAKGMKMIIIEHRISSLLSIADSMVTLDKGQKIFDGSTADFSRDERVKNSYLGGG